MFVLVLSDYILVHEVTATLQAKDPKQQVSEVVSVGISWNHGFMDLWICGSMDSWIDASMDPWICGFIDPWIHRSMAVARKKNIYLNVVFLGPYYSSYFNLGQIQHVFSLEFVIQGLSRRISPWPPSWHRP